MQQIVGNHPRRGDTSEPTTQFITHLKQFRIVAEPLDDSDLEFVVDLAPASRDSEVAQLIASLVTVPARTGT